MCHDATMQSCGVAHAEAQFFDVAALLPPLGNPSRATKGYNRPVRLVLLVLIALTSVARADSTSVAVVVNAPESVQQKTRDVIVNWFDTHGLAVEQLPFPKDALKTFLDCLVLADMTCARGVLEKRGRSNNIVGITELVSGKGDKRSVQLSAYWIAKEQEVVSLQRTCDACTDAVLADALVTMIDDLVTRTPAMRGTIRVTSEPPNMKVMIDNEAAGSTPLDRPVSFGQHVVSIMRDDRVVAQKKINVKPGASLDVPITVPDEPEGETITIVEHRSGSRAVPIVLLTVGVAAAVTGIVLYQTGGPTGESFTYRNMRPAGIATGISGVVAMAVGGVWLLRTRNAESSSAPNVSITSTSATIGWARSF
jgi:hypothetical protein